MNGQRYTVTATAHGRQHKSSGLTHKQAVGLVSDLKEWGADDAAMTPEPNMVWSALTIEQRRERSKFWQAVVASVLIGMLFAVVFWCSTIGICKAFNSNRASHQEECAK